MVADRTATVRKAAVRKTADRTAAGRTAAEPGTTQRGTGLLGTMAGLVVFMFLMLAAVQVLFNLYATTMLTSAAWDAARFVAGFDQADHRCGAIPVAEARFYAGLGDYSETGEATLRWTCNHPDWVRVEITADHPSILPERLRGLLGLGRLERSIEVRVEDRR